MRPVFGEYYKHQHSRIQAGEIKLRQVYDQTVLLKDFVQHMGISSRLSEINTISFQDYRRRLIKQGKSATRINNYISAFKAMYHWEIENELISNVPNLSSIKKLPRSKTSKPTFAPEEIRRLLNHASLTMKAMI